MIPIPQVDRTPRLVVEEPVLDANIERMAGAIVRHGGRALRPHFKTSKMVEVARRQIAAGATGMTCATAGELSALVDAGFTDLFWAHQPVGDGKVRAVIDLARRCDLRIALDSMAAAQPVSDAAEAAERTISWLLEIDTGLGRAGVLPADAVPVAQSLSNLPGLRFQGIFTHEGHLYQTRDVAERAAAGTALGETMAATADALRHAGLDCPTVSVGATPAAASAPFAQGVTEARPGTYVFNDDNQTFLGVATHEQCAVRVIARVVSRPRAGGAIIDAGLKAMSSDRSLRHDGFGTPAGYDRLAFDGAYEEHGLLTGPDADRLEVGDLVAIIPNHVCGAVNMWSSALVTRDGDIIDEWSIVGRH